MFHTVEIWGTCLTCFVFSNFIREIGKSGSVSGFICGVSEEKHAHVYLEQIVFTMCLLPDNTE